MLLCEKGKKLFSEDECETRVANDSNSLNGFYFRSIPSTAFLKWGSRGEPARRIFGTCAIFTQEAAPEITRGFLTSRLHSERSKTLLEKITLCVSRGVAAIVQQDVVTSLRLSSEKTRKMFAQFKTIVDVPRLFKNWGKEAKSTLPSVCCANYQALAWKWKLLLLKLQRIFTFNNKLENQKLPISFNF